MTPRRSTSRASFYRGLLPGVEFGEAVRSARETVYGLHGTHCNTWGAYQCYGDPSWTLSSHVIKEAPLPGRSSRLTDVHRCMSAAELSDRILQVCSIAGDKPAAAMLEQVDELVEMLGKDQERREWLNHSRVRAAFAEAYRVLAAPEQAARWYQLGARRAQSSVQIGQLEQLVKSMTRARGAGAAGTRKAASKLIALLDSISEDPELLWPLTEQEHATATAAAERRFLAGEIRLREAAESTGPTAALVEPLQLAAQCFATGYREKKLRREPAPRRAFALANALLAAALAGLAAGRAEDASAALSFDHKSTEQARAKACADPATTVPSQAEDWLGEAEDLQRELQTADDHTSFWSQTDQVELLFARGVLAYLFDPSLDLEPGLSEVLRQLQALAVRPPTPVELGTVRLCFDLVARVAQPELIDDYADMRHALEWLVEEALPLLTPRS